ncbi:MAG: hypothetical protein NZ653_10195, partial [Anaerolineae bacterium]|nr:hypothetical protein [Anaerolineae bacterium]
CPRSLRPSSPPCLRQRETFILWRPNDLGLSRPAERAEGERSGVGLSRMLGGPSFHPYSYEYTDARRFTTTT